MGTIFVDDAGRICEGEIPPAGIYVDANGCLVEGVDAPTNVSIKAEARRLVRAHIESLRQAGAAEAAARAAWLAP